MRHICSWSGGKDSTASIIIAHEHNEPLDTILFAEVMFDKVSEISGENPRHMDFIKNKAKPLFESWGYKVEILRADKDYLDLFYHIIECPKKHKEHVGMYAGFPASGACSVKRDCKLKPINDYYMALTEPFIQYVGICIDEPKRLKSLHNSNQIKGSNVSLLEKYGYTEEMARNKCLEKWNVFGESLQKREERLAWECSQPSVSQINLFELI